MRSTTFQMLPLRSAALPCKVPPPLVVSRGTATTCKALNTEVSRRRKPDSRQDSTSRLRLFLDSANLTQWELWMSTGLFHGFTTNPAILEKDSQKCTLKNLSNLARHASELGASELQLQVWGESVQKLYSVALDLVGINPRLVVVKLPCTIEGIQAASLLRESNVRVTITGIYTSPQVLMAQAVGAEYAAPYLGRMNDAYGNNQGYTQCLEMQRILSSHHSKTRLLVASVRDPSEMASLASHGCDTFTISPAVAGKLFNVSYTLDAAAEFEGAARRMGAFDDPSLNNGSLLGSNTPGQAAKEAQS